MMVKVAVGTSNPLKLRSVEKVFKQFMEVEYVLPIDIKDIEKQPVGTRSLVRGALLRAVKSRIKAGSDYGVGIEAGLMEFYTSTGFIETQVVAIVNSMSEVSFGLSPSFELPDHIVRQMINGVELAEAFNRERGWSRDIGEYIGVIGILTYGRITRLDLTSAAVLMALIPHLYRETYKLARVEDVLSRLGIKL